MGISINSASVSPQDITPLRVRLTVTYNGLVDSDADNPVTITMSLEDGTAVYIAANTTDKKKSITWTDNLPVGEADDRVKALYVGIDPADSDNTCTVAFHFQSNGGGDSDDEQTHFNL